MFFTKTEVGVLLIALGLGYVVCFLANREEKLLRLTGFSIGALIIGMSCLLILAKVALRIKTCKDFSSCKAPILRAISPPQIK